MSDSTETTERTESIGDQLLELSRQLLAAIDAHDLATYRELCDPSLTAFEPEAVGHMVEGMRFHEFYLDSDTGGPKRRSTISSANVRVMGEVAVVCYIRLVQATDPAGVVSTTAMEETRVWHRQGDRWQHVHFHRSPTGRIEL